MTAIASMTPADLKAAAGDVHFAARAASKAKETYGCCRVYVVLEGRGLRANEKAVAIFRAAGLRLTQRPGYKGLRIYVGYDNCTGVELGKGEAMARMFSRHGIDADMDYDGD